MTNNIMIASPHVRTIILSVILESAYFYAIQVYAFTSFLEISCSLSYHIEKDVGNETETLLLVKEKDL